MTCSENNILKYKKAIVSWDGIFWFFLFSLSGKEASCLKIDHDKEIYTLNAGLGRWPKDGFCHALVPSNASKHDTYKVSADFYVSEVKGSSDEIYLGVFYNAVDEDNFDFVLFR